LHTWQRNHSKTRLLEMKKVEMGSTRMRRQ
jgi:hypothetical protein